MTKAAYSTHLRSSPPSHVSASATALWQPYCFSTIVFDLGRETQRGWSLGWPLENRSLDTRGRRRDRRKTEVKDQFSCLKWSMKLYFVTCKGSSLRSTSPLDVILAPSPSPHTNRTLQPHLLVERTGRNSETPRL